MSNSKEANHRRLISILILSIFIISFSVFYFGLLPKHDRFDEFLSPKIDGVYLPSPQEITNFHLTDDLGQPFNKENLKGHWTLLFFGFTNCGDVCPTTMAELNKMYKKIEAKLPKELPQVIMISVDKQRDSTQRIHEYVTAFNPHFKGANGSDAEMLALEKQLHIVSAKLQADGQSKDHYTITHSAEIILFDPEARVQAFFAYPHEATQMEKDYQNILQFASK